jgi:hypothetical protein
LLDLKFLLYFSTIPLDLNFGQKNSSIENCFSQKHAISNFSDTFFMKVLPSFMILLKDSKDPLHLEEPTFPFHRLIGSNVIPKVIFYSRPKVDHRA